MFQVVVFLSNTHISYIVRVYIGPTDSCHCNVTLLITAYYVGNVLTVETLNLNIEMVYSPTVIVVDSRGATRMTVNEWKVRLAIMLHGKSLSWVC